MNILKRLLWGIDGLRKYEELEYQYNVINEDYDTLSKLLDHSNSRVKALNTENKNLHKELSGLNKKIKSVKKEKKSSKNAQRKINKDLKEKLEDVKDRFELKLRECEGLKDKIERLEKSSNTSKGGYQREINKWKYKYLYVLKVMFREGLPNVEWQKKDVEIFLKQELKKMKDWEEKSRGVAK